MWEGTKASGVNTNFVGSFLLCAAEFHAKWCILSEPRGRPRMVTLSGVGLQQHLGKGSSS